MIKEPVFSQANFDDKLSKIVGQTNIECKTGVDSSEVRSIISATASVSPVSSEVLSGQVKYCGRAVVCVCFENAEGELKKVESGVEFSGSLDNALIETGYSAELDFFVERAEAFEHNGTVSVRAVIGINLELSGSKTVKAFTDSEELILKKQEIPLIKTICCKKGAYPVEEEFELGYAVAEVLSHQSNAVITAAQCGIGAVIADGEIVLSCLMLQSGEKSAIIKETKLLPFRLELECEEAMPSMQADARVRVKNVKIDVVVDEQSGKSTLSVCVTLELSGEAYIESSMEIVCDAFSTSEEIELVGEDFSYGTGGDCRTFLNKVSGKGILVPPEENLRLVCLAQERLNLVSAEKDSEQIKIDAVIEATAFFKDADGSVKTAKTEIPVSAALETSIDNDCEFSTCGIIEDISARTVFPDEIEVDAALRFTVCVRRTRKIKVIGSVAAGAEKQRSEAAISVYIPMENEELWSLAKRLNVNPSDVAETNKELTFPLSGKERIVVYRRKNAEY